MATKLKEVDVVIVGLGWTGGILAKELTEAGLKVVALERGAMRSPEKDFAVPIVRDELRFVVRHDLMQNTARDTLTIRNNPSQEALPMRRLGSFLPGEVVGGSVLQESPGSRNPGNDHRQNREDHDAKRKQINPFIPAIICRSRSCSDNRQHGRLTLCTRS